MRESTVFVVDDDAGVRASIQALINGGGLPVRCYDSAEEFLLAFDEAWRGCVVLDIKMPGMSGIELLRQMRNDSRQLPVIMVTGHADIAACVDTMKNGAVDFLEKPYHPKQLLKTVRDAIQLDKETWTKRHVQHELQRKLDLLTSEEKHVLRGIGEGRLLKNIATELDVSLRTVQFRRASILEKLGVSNRAQLVQIAAAWRAGW